MKWLFGCGLLAMVGSASAQEFGGRLDPAASRAEFSLRVLLVRRLEGHFEFLQGAVRPGADPRHFDVEVQIAAQSLSMNNPDHADWAQSAEFFDVQRFPWITFQAHNAPEALLNEGGELIGLLSLRGVTRPARFQLLPPSCDRPGINCPLQARGELQRSEFGMDARRWAVSDKVKLAFSIRLQHDGGES